MKTFLKILGFLGLLISTPLILAAIIDLVGGAENAQGPAIALVFFVVMAIGSVLALRSAYSRKESARPSAFQMEQAVLRLAHAMGGRLTVAEVAAHCGLTLDESEEALKRMIHKGAADLQVTDGGALVYRFSGFLPPEEKARAEDIL